MKKIILLSSIALLSLGTMAQTTAPATAHSAPKTVAAPVLKKVGKAPQIKFETTNLDYGTIKKSSEPFREFVFKNTGKEPLIISNAVGSCGCTIPTYPKEPIMPGKKAAIKVRYDTERIGAFTKTVTLTTNAPNQESTVLTIHGVVTAPEVAPVVEPTPVRDEAPVQDVKTLIFK